MALRTRSKLEEWKQKYGDMSAFDIARLLRGHLPGSIGGGAKRTRIVKGEQVVMAQILYNKLVDGELIKGEKITVDGIWGERETGAAIKKMRELVGTIYSAEEKKKLKNKKIELTLDGRTVDLLVKKLTPVESITPKKVEKVEARIRNLEKRLKGLNELIKELSERTSIYDEGGGDIAMDGIVNLDSLIMNTEEATETLRKKVKKGGAQAVEKELGNLEKDVGRMEDMVAGLDALIALDTIGIEGMREDKKRGAAAETATKRLGGHIGGAIDRYMDTLPDKVLKFWKKNLQRGIDAETKSTKPNRKLIKRLSLGLENVEREIKKRNKSEPEFEQI